jgi:hypothetical protein
VELFSQFNVTTLKLELAVRLPGAAGGGALTVIETLADAVPPMLSVTVKVAV